MDPIPPIAPGPPGFRGQGSLPVDRLERVSRERDRPSREGRQQPRRGKPDATRDREPPDEDGRPHIDVRV